MFPISGALHSSDVYAQSTEQRLTKLSQAVGMLGNSDQDSEFMKTSAESSTSPFLFCYYELRTLCYLKELLEEVSLFCFWTRWTDGAEVEQVTGSPPSAMAERPPFSFVTNPSHHVAGSPFCIFWWTLLFGGLLRRQWQLMHPGASRWSTGQAQRILLVNLSPHWMNYVLWLLLWLLSQGLKPNCLFSFWGSLASNFCFCQWICMNFVFPINSACNNISNFRFV